jgi:hypothetical protein
MVKIGLFIDPAKVTLCSRTQSTSDEKNLPENSTASPFFIPASDLKSCVSGAISVSSE